jgi:uncharacterized protein (TIGR02246 family)
LFGAGVACLDRKAFLATAADRVILIPFCERAAISFGPVVGMNLEGTGFAGAQTRRHFMTENRTADELAIQAVLDDSYRAWAAGDADGMVADYTLEASAVMPGSLRGSREVIRESMASAFAGPLKGTSTRNEQLSVRFVGRDVAIVLSESGILFPGQSEVSVEGRVHCTWVLEKRDGRWLIAAYHNSPVQV